MPRRGALRLTPPADAVPPRPCQGRRQQQGAAQSVMRTGFKELSLCFQQKLRSRRKPRRRRGRSSRSTPRGRRSQGVPRLRKLHQLSRGGTRSKRERSHKGEAGRGRVNTAFTAHGAVGGHRGPAPSVCVVGTGRVPWPCVRPPASPRQTASAAPLLAPSTAPTQLQVSGLRKPRWRQHHQAPAWPATLPSRARRLPWRSPWWPEPRAPLYQKWLRCLCRKRRRQRRFCRSRPSAGPGGSPPRLRRRRLPPPPRRCFQLCQRQRRSSWRSPTRSVAAAVRAAMSGEPSQRTGGAGAGEEGGEGQVDEGRP